MPSLGAWEYWAIVVLTDELKNEPMIRQYIERVYSGYTPGKSDVRLLDAFLNLKGADGWELIRLEPAQQYLGQQGDWRMIDPANITHYVKSYFCVFKRPHRIGRDR